MFRPRPNSFLDKCRRGEATAQDIDEFVSAWHRGPIGEDLSEFLGLTVAEYEAWVMDPAVLPYIVISKKEGRSLAEVCAEQAAPQRTKAR